MAVALLSGNVAPFTQEFTNTTTLVINHYLGYYPNVYIVVNNQMIMADVQHNNANQFVVSFLNALSGTVFYS